MFADKVIEILTDGMGPLEKSIETSIRLCDKDIKAMYEVLANLHSPLIYYLRASEIGKNSAETLISIMEDEIAEIPRLYTAKEEVLTKLEEADKVMDYYISRKNHFHQSIENFGKQSAKFQEAIDYIAKTRVEKEEDL